MENKKPTGKKEGNYYNSEKEKGVEKNSRHPLSEYRFNYYT